MKEATALLSRSDRAGSRKVLELLAKDFPTSPHVWNLLGFVQGQERDLVAALSSLKRAVELSPDMPEARYNLGVAFWYSGQRASAIESLEHSIRLNPAAAEVYAFLGMARRDTGDLDRARPRFSEPSRLARTFKHPTSIWRFSFCVPDKRRKESASWKQR